MIDWDDAFDNTGYVAGAAELAQRWADAAAAFRADAVARDRAELDLPYADGARNRIDIFYPESPPAGLLLFVHGGYWHKLDRSFWSQLAAGAVTRGWAFAVPSYTLAPEARIASITREIGTAIEFAAARVDGAIRLAGHSAGGHLVARMACYDSPLPDALLRRLQRVVPISGIHDLRPLLETRMNEILRLDAAEAAAESPALLAPRSGISTCFWVGAAERPEFLRQNRLAAEAWQRRGADAIDFYEPGRHDFSVIENLADPDSALIAELTAALRTQ